MHWLKHKEISDRRDKGHRVQIPGRDGQYCVDCGCSVEGACWLEQGTHFSCSLGLSSSELKKESFTGLGQAYGETGKPKALGPIAVTLPREDVNKEHNILQQDVTLGQRKDSR